MRNSDTRNKIFNITFLSTAAATVLLCFVIYPVYITLYSDIAYQGELYTALLYYFSAFLEDIIFASLIAMSAAASFIYYGNIGKLIRSCAAVYVLDMCKYLFNIIATEIYEGHDVIEVSDFYYGGMMFGLDAAVLTLVLFCCFRADAKHRQRCKTLDKASLAARGYSYNELDEFFPFAKIVSPKRPVQTGLFHGILAALLLDLLSAVYYDIFMGLPETATQISAMIQNYLGIIITTAIMYIAAYILCVLILKKLPEYGKPEESN